MLFNIRPYKLIRALSQALEFSTSGLSRHHWRVALIADRLASHMALAERERQLLVYASLLHDLGAATNWSEKQRLLAADASDWKNVHSHARQGYWLLKDSAQLGSLAEIIRCHHFAWDGHNGGDRVGKDIPLLSRIINIADRIEVMLRDDEDIFSQRPGILAAIRQGSGTHFDPDLVRGLDELALQEAFWLDVINIYYHNYHSLFQSIDDYGHARFNLDDLLNIAGIFASIIDRTSRFTALHSRAVAQVAAFLAQAKGYSVNEVKAMRLAGLFHDLGKLAVPPAILEKPDRLSEREFAVIKQHVYYTYRILEGIDGFNVIAEWAAYHHETLDGTGYPFRVKEENLRLGSRIMAVADIYVALTENRPYRAALAPAKVEQIMRDMAASHKIDARIVDDLFANRDAVAALMGEVYEGGAGKTAAPG